MVQDHIQVEQEFICLLLKNKPLVEDWIISSLKASHFDTANKYILDAILDAYEKDVLLTRKSFLTYINNFVHAKKDKIAQEHLYNQIAILNPKTDDYPYLRDKIIDSFLVRSSTDIIKNLPNLRTKNGNRSAIAEIADGLKGLIDDVEIKPIFYASGTEYGPEYLKIIETANPELNIIKCHIHEVDQTLKVGFHPGSAILFCADSGGGKSTIMMNAGLNLWKISNKNVLFVPLEMPRNLYFRKMLAHETGISFDKLSSKALMTEEEWKKANDTIASWKELDHNFYIMESFDERTKVSTIKNEIKHHIDIFKPDVVVVDYIDNLDPDSRHPGRSERRSDQEIGDMIKELIHLGKPGVVHEGGFCTISGAQIGRDALKRIHKGAFDKATFYTEDLRGSHEYVMNATAVYALMPDPQQTNRIILTCIKSRYGAKTFADGSHKAVIEIIPDVHLIRSINYEISAVAQKEVLAKMDADLAEDNIKIDVQEAEDIFGDNPTITEKEEWGSDL